MKNLTSGFFIILWFLSLIINGQLPSSDERDRNWIKDITQFEKIIVDKHINPFTVIGKDAFLNFTGNLKSNLNKINDDQIIVSLMAGVALIKDSHTSINFPIRSILPFSFYFFDDGIFPTLAGKENESAFGKRLVGIGKYSIDEVVNLLKPLISHENDAQLKSIIPEYLVRPEILNGLGIISSKDTCTLIFSDSSGIKYKYTVRPVAASEMGNFRKTMVSAKSKSIPIVGESQGGPYWYKVLSDKGSIYINYNRCTENPDFPFDKFVSDIFKHLDSANINRIIIDLRNNSGGNSSIFDPMLQSIRNNDNFRRKGELFVLIGRKTFSSAVINAIGLRQKTNAIFVGEATGGKPNHFGEIQSEVLENSGFQIKYSTKYFNLVNNNSDSFYPDKFIVIKYTDFRSGRDSALEEALNWGINIRK